MSKSRKIDSFFKRKVDEDTPLEITSRDETEDIVYLEKEEMSSRKEAVFNGIENIERDPGLRPQIVDYPVNQRDEVRRAYLIIGPMQPQLQDYKPSGPQNRRFQFKWFGQFGGWLEYSKTTHRAYCLYCFLFSNNLSRRGLSDVFIVSGFDNWKRVNDENNCAFKKHIGSDHSSHHSNALKAAEDLMKQKGHLESIIHRQSKKEEEMSHLRLRVSIKVAKWLATQGCAFRGYNEAPSSSNRGNFIELIKLLAEFNSEIGEVVLENAPYNTKYISPEIQKDILSVYGSSIRKYIREEIGDFKFCIITDETCDISRKEQMTLVLRFVDQNGVIKERFFDLVHVKFTAALSLKTHICSVLSNYSLSLQNIRGQGYDGSSNMRGHLNGLQALFLKDCPCAYYVHCYAHRLQLVLVAASKSVKSISLFFYNLGFIINTIESSAKRHDELHDAQAIELARLLVIDELDTGRGANQIGSLKRAGDTRWGSHLGSISSLKNMFTATRSVLEHISEDASSGEFRGHADVCYGYLFSFEFVFCMILMKEILENAEILNQALQAEKQDIVSAIRLVRSTRRILQNLRDDGWESFLEKVKEFCERYDILVPNMSEVYILREGRARKQADHFSNEHHFLVEIYLAGLDTQLNEIDHRFNDNIMDLLSLMGVLVSSSGFSSKDIDSMCEKMEKYYSEDFSDQERIRLKVELTHFSYDISVDDKMKCDTLSDLCKQLVQSKRHLHFPLIDRLLRLLLTLPVSTASAERAFSALNIVKTKLRNKMDDGYLNDSLLIKVENDIVGQLDYDVIVQDFLAMKPRRDKTLYKK